MSVERRLQDLVQRLNNLPETKEPPPTTLQILDQQHQEQDWQRFLFYFLSPEAGHGLKYGLLEHLLSSLSERDELSYTFSRLNLQDIRTETEVISSNKTRPDGMVWLPERWFICWELKLWASETQRQTEDYIDASSFPAIDLVKDDVSPENRYYIYLAPEDASPPAANEFVQLSWEWLATELEAFLAKSHGGYPARTTAQLDDFISTIQHELKMTDHQEHQQEKAQLYFDYYDEIQDVHQAFESQWADFEDTWGMRLARTLDSAEVVEIPALPENHVAIEQKVGDGEPTRWIFRQGSSWGGIAKEQWRRRTDDFSVIYSARDDDNYAHITLYHRLEKNRKQAIKENTLELTLWHGTSSDNQFHKMVNERISTKIANQEVTLPPTIALPSGAGRILTATYTIPAAQYDDFFDAYIAALQDAFLDLSVEQTALVTIIDDAFQESLEAYYGEGNE